MKDRARFPIRFKILVSLLLVVTAVVSVITFTMANLFHEDKSTYIHDLTSMVALSTAEECRSLINGYRDRLRLYSRIMIKQDIHQAEKSDLLKELFGDFPELIAITLYREGETIATAYDANTLEGAGLTEGDISAFRTQHPIPEERIQDGGLYVSNSTLSTALPSLTIALSPPLVEDGPALVVSAVLRLDDLLQLTSRSNVFEVVITDTDGLLLAHRDVARVADREPVEVDPEVRETHENVSLGLTREYTRDGVETIGGFAAVNTGGMTTGAQIPKAAAYLATRSLLDRLMMVALVLLSVAAVASLFWARRITRPVERLSDATQEVAQGKFEIAVDVNSRDEIGILATSFNRMAEGLNERDKALHDAQSQLIQSEKMAAFGQLGAGIAHEVKNPLAGILGCAQLSLRKVDKGSAVHTNLQLIEKETKRCKEIIENLLRFARQEKAVLEPTDPNEIVEHAAAIVNHQLEMKQIKLEKSLTAGLPQILGNSNQLQQVLMNLMMNAQQAMDGKPGTITLTTSLADPTMVEIKVIDTGPGIAPEIQREVFEPFFTTKPGGKGTGLGLSVSFGIVEDHNGRISLDSAVGQGTTFRIQLPVVHHYAVQEEGELVAQPV